ncbi:MAG: glycosyltransferase [Armatimonadia bacterium]|nr:glycosyltransferase [Armatimonadia bacterium]
MAKDRLTAIVPAYNEAARIGSTVRGLRSALCVGRIIVVDDASIDATASHATGAGAELIQLARRSGKGRAVEVGLQEVDTPFVAVIDGDLAGTSALVETLAQPVLRGRADVAIAAMPMPGGRRGFGLVTGLARWAVRRYGGIEVDNPLCGQRVMTKQAALAVLPSARGFGLETRSTIVHGRLGHRVTVVPVEMTHRRTGRDWAGAWHRSRQLRDVAAEVAWWASGAGARRFPANPLPAEDLDTEGR